MPNGCGSPAGGRAFRTPKIRIYWKTIKRLKQRVREITARRRGRSLSQVRNELKQFISGWWNYYGLTESFNRLRPLPHWIRRRLRALVWKHWPPARREARAYASERKTAKPVCGNSLTGVSPAPLRLPPAVLVKARGESRHSRRRRRMSKVKWVNIALPDKHFESLGLSFPWS